MNRAAIITWCNRGINYGQVLQAYAMQRIVKKYNMDSIIIYYRRPEENETAGRLSISAMKRFYEWYYGMSKAGPEAWKVKMKFNRFVRNNITMTDPCYSKEDIERELMKHNCTTLICGSDQIWNPVAFDPVFYLSFGSREWKRIAYAPSIAEDELNAGNRHIFNKMVALIEKIDYVSVRESTGEQILQQLSNKEVITLLDPTFLIHQRGWDRIASASKSKERYIFCYVLGDIKPHREMLQKLQKIYKTSKIIYLSNKSNHYNANEEFRNDIGPEDFISLIKYAAAVYTDSFHGVAISINYNREFYTCRRFDVNAYNKNSRINNILELFDLKRRYIEESSQIIPDDYITYDKVNAILRKERRKAFRYLNCALNSEDRA